MMNRKEINAFLCVLLSLAVGIFSSCKDYDEDISGLDNRVKNLETKLKTLQNQLDDAIANGCWIGYYDIDQATGNCTLHFLGKSETLSIPSIEGKDAVLRHFRVNNGIWQWAQNDGSYVDVTTSAGATIEVSKDEDGHEILGNIVIKTVETEDMGTVQVIYVGDTETTIRCDKNDPILAVDEENKYLVVSVGGLHYTLLMEGSVFKGLQSLSYRKVYAFDDYVEAITLTDGQGEIIVESPVNVSFRVYPSDFKVEQAKFSCSDLRELKTRAANTTLTYISNTATLSNGVLTLSLQPEYMEENTYFGAVLNVELNGYTTSSDDFVVKKTTRKVTEAKVFDAGTGKEITGNLVFDEKNPFYLNTIRCGFEAGRYNVLESLEDLGFDVEVKYELDDDCKGNFTVGEDSNGMYLSVNPLASGNSGKVTIYYMSKQDGKILLQKTVNVEAMSIDIQLVADDTEGANLSEVSSLYTRASYVKLAVNALNDAGIAVNTLFDGATALNVGYMKDGVLKILDGQKVNVTGTDDAGNEGLFLFVEKQVDLDAITGGANRKTFDLYLVAENGGILQVEGSDGVNKRICLKKVNFYYQPYFKVRDGLDKEYIIFDNGNVDNNVSDINNFPKASIKGKAIVGRTVGNDNYSFENIKFSELYDWSPEDYVTFAISQADQTDYMKTEWGKTFEYTPAAGGFSVHKPCHLRKLNFGTDQKAEKDADGKTIQNTNGEMKAKGGNEGLKIRYQIADKQEVIDNWYFLDPISFPGDRWFYFHYRFNLSGADQIYCYAGAQSAGSQIDILRCLTNTEGLSVANADKLTAFTSNMCWDWYFTDEAGSNNIISVVAKDENTSEIVVSDWAKQRYGDIVVSFVGPSNNKTNFTYTAGAAPENFVVTNVKDLVNSQMELKITTDYGEQTARFTLKKR